MRLYRRLPEMKGSSYGGLCSRTRIASCAALQHFIARQMPIPLCPAQVGGATSMCAPRPDPQPPQISEGETNQNFSDGGASLSEHRPSSDETQNNRQYSQRFQKRSTTVFFASPSGAAGLGPQRRASCRRQRLSRLLRERRCRVVGLVVVAVLRRRRISANSASAHPQGCGLSHSPRPTPARRSTRTPLRTDPSSRWRR